MTVYIKNPYRGRKTPKQKPYQPEYKRLGVEPCEYPVKDQNEFEKLNRKAEMEKKQLLSKQEKNAKAKEAVELFKNEEISKEDLEKILQGIYNEPQTQELAIPSKIVTSGQNEDILWTKANLSSKPEKTEEVPEVEEEPEPEEFLDTDVSLPPDEEYVSDVDGGFDLGQIDVGEYVLLYKSSVLGTGGIKSVKDTLSSVLESEENVDIDDFVVLKRVPVKMGVFVDE